MICRIDSGTTSAVVTLFDKAVSVSSRGYRLSLFWLASSLLLYGLPALIALYPSAAFAVDPACAVSPNSVSRTLNVPPYRSYRHLVGGDYVTIEYDAVKNKTTWSDYNRIFDYKGLNGQANTIDWNGSFLPIIYTKEKIAVRVCGLHFTDVLTVTTGPTGVPEGAADIRGAAPVTPVVSLSSTLDTLQSGQPTGGTTTLPGLGLNAPATIPSLAVSGVTPGNLGAEDQTPGKYPSYTPAAVTASGRQVALLLYSVDKNAAELSTLIDRTLGTPYAQPSGTPYAKESRNAPGSVNGVAYMLGFILKQVKNDSKDPSDSAAFDKHLTDIENINAQISTLSSSLSSQAFASNAIALLNNYSVLTGVLDLAYLGARSQDSNCQSDQPLLQPPDLSALSQDDLNKITFNDFANWTSAQVLSLSDKQIDLLPDSSKLREKVRSLKKGLVQLGFRPTPDRSANDQPLCSIFERKKFNDFWKGFSAQLSAIIPQADQDQYIENYAAQCAGSLATPEIGDIYECKVGETLRTLNANLDHLRKELGAIDQKATELYDKMNEWYFDSNVEQTDLLPPLTGNAMVRISIVVQRGYTPFTLANANGTITPAVTANTVPMTTTAASTSTPAHAVKTILVEVHRVANFNLMGGVMFIHIPTASYAVQSSPTPAAADPTSSTGYSETCGGKKTPVPAPASGSSPPTYSCILQTQQTDWQTSGMAGLLWYPWGHDYFPRHSGYANFGRNLLPSVILATSVTSLGNSMGGLNWEPVSGLDFYAGVGSAHTVALPAGLSVTAPVPTGTTINTVIHEHAGFTVGVGFDLGIISTLFGSKSTSVASMP